MIHNAGTGSILTVEKCGKSLEIMNVTNYDDVLGADFEWVPRTEYTFTADVPRRYAQEAARS